MVTSGTTTFDLDLAEMAEIAFERCGRELRTGKDMRKARRALNLLLSEWANKGVNLWTIDSAVIPLVQGTATYNLPSDTVDVVEHQIRTGTGDNQSDITINRIALPTYASIPNKNRTGRPIQIYVDRQAPTPTVTVWPAPNDGSYSLVYWRMRRLEDAGDGVNTQDVPFRFLPALTAGLAYYLAQELPGAFERLPTLKQAYDISWQAAADEDRDRANYRVTPRIGR